MNNFLSIIYSLIISFGLTTIACQTPIEQLSKPNVILIMADDIGFECLSINGSKSYKTPVLDSLATQGINFTNAISQPLCTPSRVKIMTGKFNYKNYDYFTYLNPKEKSFGNLFKENGYKTAIVGKWQLNGIVHKLEGFDDNSRPNHFGFDEYSLWQLTKTKSYGERFANPYIEQNGKILPRDENAYGPDIVSNYAIDFIKRNRDQPFFIYYPMLLVHSPFVPTPDSPEWQSLDTRSKQENRFYIDMVAYMDKIVGKIVNELKNQGIAENTLLYFVGDNGTKTTLVSLTENGPVRGGKGNTITHGNHVPMVASWPKKIKEPSSYDHLINFTDFYATFCDILGLANESDGLSMIDVLSGEKLLERETVTTYYDPMWSQNVSQFRNVYSQNSRYKLYKNGKFFDMENDILEKQSLNDDELSEEQKNIKVKLAAELVTFPSLPKTSLVKEQNK
jgi:arylsulfatase A